jgi:hypothetical protein
MVTTTVSFTLSVPVRKLNTEESTELDTLLRNWHERKEITRIRIQWLAVPKKRREGMTALVELSMKLRTRSRNQLLDTYNDLSEEVNTKPLSLSGRSIVLSDLID